MTESKKAYREIFRATSLFGGVQVFNIIIAIIRSKFVAILIGPQGMGISGLFVSTTDFIGRLTNLGLGTSAVKNVAEAYSSKNIEQVARVVTVLRRLVWFTGILGMILMAIFSSGLSQLTFGNKDYTGAFIWISVTLLFQQLTSGQLVILQGLRKLQSLAKANLLGSLFGLVFIIPLYYFWGVDGIVPALICVSATSMLLAWIFAKKVKISSLQISAKATFLEGKGMMRMGFLLSMSGLINLGAAYLIRIFISNAGGVDDVGLYNAGFALINTYTGMIFTAMGTDYYPRLASVSGNNSKSGEMINQQAEVAILILAPILIIFMVYIRWVIVLLYSNKFIPINEMIQWAAIGIYFKAVSWSISYSFVAKGAGRLYFWNEFSANLYMLLLNIVGYRILGLEGLGLSFLLGYAIYLIQVYVISAIKYQFKLHSSFFRIVIFQLVLGIGSFVIMRIIENPWMYIIGTILILISVFYSFRELEKRIGFSELLKTFIHKRRKK